MAEMIDGAGLYALEADDYHADPCPEPSLSSSIATVLLDECPRKAWQAHPRLNPEWEPAEPAKRLDFGTVVHTLLLGKGKDFAVVDAPDYKTKAAQIKRDAIREFGRVPILVGDYERACAMVLACRDQLADAKADHVFTSHAGQIEIMVAARDVTGVWGRRLIDFYGNRIKAAIEVWDYKTVQQGSANPDTLQSRMLELDYVTSCAMAERLLLTVKPELAGRIKHRFLFQEAEPPYLISAVEPLEDAMTIGRKRVAAAFALWAKYLKAGAWPGYPKRVVGVPYPRYAEERWTAWELAHADEIAADPYLEAAPWVAAARPDSAAGGVADSNEAAGKRNRRKGKPAATPAQGTLLDAG